MFRILTDEELAEDDMRIEIVESDFYKLSPKIQNLIRSYHNGYRMKKGCVMCFSMPAYRWREEIAPLLNDEQNVL